jgi:hypothetical protein
MKDISETYNAEDPIPVFKSWIGWYVLVLVNLVILIGLFYVFTIAFN